MNALLLAASLPAFQLAGRFRGAKGQNDMPSGERSQVWYPEIVAVLRAKWRADLSWQSLIELRDLLQSRLDHLRAARAIVPPVFRCPSCGAIGPSKPPVISVRAMLISVKRFGIDTSEIVASREHEWARYRSRLKLDLCGQPSHGGTVDPEHASCIRASPGALRN